MNGCYFNGISIIIRCKVIYRSLFRREGQGRFIESEHGHEEENIMKKRVIFLAISLLLATVAAGHAEVKAGAFSITPFIGGYTFEGNEDLKSAPVVGLRGGYYFTRNLGIEGFFHYVPTESTSLAGNPKVKLYGMGIEGLYHFMPESRLVPFLAVGVGGNRYNVSGAIKDRDRFTVDYGAGMKFFLTDNLALRADIRHVILPLHDRYNELLYTIGLDFSFGGAKKAVAMPEVMTIRAAEPAAPAAVTVAVVKDSDGDGVVDDLDRCPGTPSGVQVDKDGCPLDSDRDGVYDYLDKCPGTPVGVKVDRDGCPLDSDGDGVYDYLDKCPGTPAGVKVDMDGCPLDSDKDGVPDYLDKCPGTPVGVKVDKDGCPPPPPPAPVVQKSVRQAASAMEVAIVEKGRVTLNVEFDTAKSIVKKSYHGEIAKLAEVMKKYPDLKITVEGHTDNVGGLTYNEKLSQSRAEAVKNYLVTKFGIEASRLNSKGYGPIRPIESNATKEGRQKNRRVEAAADYTIKK
jgi:OOP family OmpA-OmpF porin